MYKCECGFLFEYPEIIEVGVVAGVSIGDEVEVCPKCGSENIKKVKED